MTTGKSTLVYDGDCGICREWVDNWQVLTGDRVDYRPYQEAAEDFPGIPYEAFEESIQLIEADGHVSSGADATFRLYQGIFPLSILNFLYRYLPGFGWLSEAGYTFFSRHRGLLAFVTHLLWGRNSRPSRYELVSRLFLICLGLIYFSAFLSFSVQARALIGRDGILPLHFYINRLAEHFGDGAWLNVPMLFWLNSSDPAIQLTCVAGCLVSLLLIFNIFRTVSLVVLYFLYLSLYYAGQTFMSFQWDVLLIEAGFLAIFLGKGSRIVVWLYRWLIFRFMLLSGLVKLAGRDPTWDNLTALFYHFETQPLPTPLAWPAHYLPDTVLIALAAATFIIELLVPFLIFTPRRIRFLAAWLFIIFQTGILLTGNYNFFNLLTISLCLFLFDDAALRSCIPARFKPAQSGSNWITTVNPGLCIRSLFAVLIVFASTEQLLGFLMSAKPGEYSIVSRALAPLNAVNNYGPFAIMTTERNEIIIEGSNDRVDWKEYGFRYKPDALDKPLRWIIPHQPRVDWQMWFAALSRADREIWFRRMLYQCLEGKKQVLALFKHNPFPDRPPVWIRARFYRYEFTTADERRRSGNIWKRQFVREYQEAIRLRASSD
ncbi:MAG: lipase maturation factor family protein [Gammaproteobacteria bacterium]|nr:lipase maturation factor family protein [Gammaproteobacteria bacterium]